MSAAKMPRWLSKLSLVGLAAFLFGCSALQGVRTTGENTLSNPAPEVALAVQADAAFAQGLSTEALAKARDAEIRALDYGKAGEAISWIDDGDEIRGEVKAFQPFRVGTSSCRRFEHVLKVNSETRQANATACRTGTANWRLVR